MSYAADASVVPGQQAHAEIVRIARFVHDEMPRIDARGKKRLCEGGVLKTEDIGTA